MIGICKLCLNEDVELRDSHYIPKAIYKQLRQSGSENPNPFEISNVGSVQTSKQLKRHLLCAACEGRLSAGGESWVLRNFRKADGTFGLASILDNSTPSIQLDGNETKVYAASEIPGIDVKALAYFSASIFWRGSLYGWNDDGSVPVPLGPYAESFREYLLGEASFPENVALLIAKRDGGEVSSLTSTPVGKRLGLVRTYKFAMPGIAIAIAVGKGLTPTMRRLCFAHGKGNPIASTPLLEAIIQADAVKKLQSHLAPPSKRSTRW